MHRHVLGFVALLCLHCGGGQTPTAAPGEEAPAPPAAEAPAAAPEAPDPGAAASGAPAEEAKPPEEKKPVAKEIGTQVPAGSAGGKPECAKLPKSSCKVTNGCAWSDTNKCVDEGPGR